MPNRIPAFSHQKDPSSDCPNRIHAFYMAISTFLPMFEYFANSILLRYKRDPVSVLMPPELAARVDDFIEEEANHSRAHARYNGINIPADLLEDFKKRDNFYREKFKEILAKTKRSENAVFQIEVFEHYTQVVGRLTLEKYADSLTGDGKTLWVWHSEEEIAHAPVIGEVLACHPKIPARIRRKLFLIMSAIFAREALYRTKALLKKTNPSWKKEFAIFLVKDWVILVKSSLNKNAASMFT